MSDVTRNAFAGQSPQQHVTDVQLTAGIGENWQHLDDCLRCRTRAAAADLTPDMDDETFLKEIRTSLSDATPAGWDLAVPSTAVLDLVSNAGRSEEVLPGELWTAAWHDMRHMVAVLYVDRWSVQVAPVTTDADMADEYTLIFGAQSSPLEVPLAAWGRAQAVLPLYTFESRLSELPACAGHAAAAALRTVAACYETGRNVPDELPVGAPLHPDDFDRRALVDSLIEDMTHLAAAQSCIYLEADGREESEASISVATLMVDSGLGLRDMSEASGISMADLVKIKQADHATTEQAEALAPLLETTPEALAGSQVVPDELIVAASRPSRRAERQEWTTEIYPGEDPENPMPLIRDTLTEKMAARRTPVTNQSTPGARSAAQNFWDSRVQLTLRRR